MVSSVDFAKYIILCFNELKTSNSDFTLNKTKLQKILYICDGILLALDCNLIEENARVWPHGPVYPKVFKWYTKNKNWQEVPVISKELQQHIENNSIISKTVNKVLFTFGNTTAMTLSNWSHLPNSPWEKAFFRDNYKFAGIIDKDDMKVYFSKMAGTMKDE